VIHRDIKPGNLMVDKRGVVKVLDMGLARLEDMQASAPGAQTRGRLTVRHQTLGTADYMAPEQADDTRLADARSDIYALGATLHYLLTGRPPFVAETSSRILEMHHDSPAPSLRAERSDVPAGLEAIYQRMMAKAPADRYQTMTEVMVALEGCGVHLTLPQGVKVAGVQPAGSDSIGEIISRPSSGADPSAPREPAAGSGSVVQIASGSSVARSNSGSQPSTSGADETVVFEARQRDTDVAPPSSASTPPQRSKLPLAAAIVLAVVLLGALVAGAALLLS
jgi:serine/threonine-protein kinase